MDKVTGVSASFCHTLVKNAFSRANRDCGWQDMRREASEQVNTDFEYLFAWLKPPRM